MQATRLIGLLLVTACGSSTPPVVTATPSDPVVAPPRALMIAPAPITADGHVTARPTDYVFVLVPDAAPEVAGLSLAKGEALRLALPSAFVRDPAVEVRADADTNLVLTKGWPQGAVKLAGQYQVGFDVARHAMVATAVVDLGADGPSAPGIKVIHVRGRTFVNPAPGDYPVTVEHLATDGGVRATWAGTITVVGAPAVARVAPSNFHVPPGTNANFQTVRPSEPLPHALGMLLWAGATPLDRVGIAPRDLEKFPRYTGGLLVQDTSGDHVLDPAVDRVVGGIIGAAPPGAKGQAATSVLGPDGKPVLSGESVRHPSFPTGGGAPVPGLLVVAFRAGDLPGAYQPTFELIDGNAVKFTIRVTGG